MVLQRPWNKCVCLHQCSQLHFNAVHNFSHLNFLSDFMSVFVIGSVLNVYLMASLNLFTQLFLSYSRYFTPFLTGRFIFWFRLRDFERVAWTSLTHLLRCNSCHVCSAAIIRRCHKRMDRNFDITALDVILTSHNTDVCVSVKDKIKNVWQRIQLTNCVLF